MIKTIRKKLTLYEGLKYYFPKYKYFEARRKDVYCEVFNKTDGVEIYYNSKCCHIFSEKFNCLSELIDYVKHNKLFSRKKLTFVFYVTD